MLFEETNKSGMVRFFLSQVEAWIASSQKALLATTEHNVQSVQTVQTVQTKHR